MGDQFFIRLADQMTVGCKQTGGSLHPTTHRENLALSVSTLHKRSGRGPVIYLLSGE